MAKGGHAWDTTRYRGTINEWAVRILLECILVTICCHIFSKAVPSALLMSLEWEL